MAKQSKNKVKLNAEYEHLGTFPKSALMAIRERFDVPEGANKIRANMNNTLKHNKKHLEQIEPYLEELGLTKENYIRFIASNFNQIRRGNAPKTVVMAFAGEELNHVAAVHLVFDRNENFWMIKSVRAERKQFFEEGDLIWER